MLACEAKQVDAGKLLIAAFPRCVPWSNKQGMDAVSFSSLTLSSPTVSPLTVNLLPIANALLPQRHPSPPPSPPNIPPTRLADGARQRRQHRAPLRQRASGELKALRLLLQYGASPLAQNAYSWTPIAYSATAAAEAYFKQLVAEFERRRVEAVQQQREMEMQRLAGVRLVTNMGGGSGDETGSSVGTGGRSTSALGFGGENGPTAASGAPQIGLDWSPITPMERIAMTPTEGMGGWPLMGTSNRRRAGSGE
jgi:hypothetical protein